MRKKTQKFGPTREAFVKYCKNCEDTSFPSIPEGKCCRCGKGY